jgi:signal transduction histidine kinase
MLQSIVMNLIANAIEFSNTDGIVNINTVIENDNLILTIEDFGKGIEASEYKHIFDRFHQIEHGSTKKHQGHGLGLSIVKEFADCLSGELHIESEKGKTTLIKISLPAFSAEQLPEGFSTGNDILFSDEEVL